MPGAPQQASRCGPSEPPCSACTACRSPAERRPAYLPGSDSASNWKPTAHTTFSASAVGGFDVVEAQALAPAPLRHAGALVHAQADRLLRPPADPRRARAGLALPARSVMSACGGG
jgi:hypothetical protein